MSSPIVSESGDGAGQQQDPGLKVGDAKGDQESWKLLLPES